MGKATSYRVLGGIRSLPVGGDVKAATERLKTLKVYPLDPPQGWKDPTWLDLTPEPQDTTADRWEDNLGYWEALYEVVNDEPTVDLCRVGYGELAAPGIEKGQPSDRTRRPIGSRPSPTEDGSSTSASTGRNRPRSTVPGDFPTSNAYKPPAIEIAGAVIRPPWPHRAAAVGGSAKTGNDRASLLSGPGRTVEFMDGRSEVKEFLASRRARVSPAQTGLTAYGANRRVKGLRREEVALLAGVSVDYYVRLERGNLHGVSEQVLDALARALQLDEAERAHLFDLARAANSIPAARRRRPASGYGRACSASWTWSRHRRGCATAATIW